jgi:hypothetical protein
MNISGQTVKHKIFGEGTISEIDNASVTVDFNGETRRFIYPQAFNGYLIAVDPSFGEYISGILKEKSVTVSTAIADKPKTRAKAKPEFDEQTKKERYESFISSAYSMWSEEWQDECEEKWFR